MNAKTRLKIFRFSSVFTSAITLSGCGEIVSEEEARYHMSQGWGSNYTPVHQSKVFGGQSQSQLGYTPAPQQKYVYHNSTAVQSGYTPAPQQRYLYHEKAPLQGGYAPAPQQNYVYHQQPKAESGYTPAPQLKYVQNPQTTPGGGEFVASPPHRYVYNSQTPSAASVPPTSQQQLQQPQKYRYINEMSPKEKEAFLNQTPKPANNLPRTDQGVHDGLAREKAWEDQMNPATKLVVKDAGWSFFKKAFPFFNQASKVADANDKVKGIDGQKP